MPLNLHIAHVAQHAGEPLELILECRAGHGVKLPFEDPQCAASAANGYPGVVDGIRALTKARETIEDEADLVGEVPGQR